MNLEEFTHQIQQAHERAALLAQERHTMHAQELLPVAIEDLSTALEELRAAEDELRMQHTALEQAHRRLDQERHYYQELFEAVPDAYLVTDLQGVIQEANHAAASLLQTPQRFLVGKPLALFVADSDVRTFRDQITQLRHSENNSEWLLHIQPRRGQAQTTTARVSVGHDWHGAALSLRWLLRRHSGHTHHSPDSEQESQQRALRLRDALMQSATYELRDCLTPIYGYADYLQRLGAALNGTDPRIIRMLRAITSQSVRIEHLITALLDWSTLDRQQSPPQFELFDLTALVEQVIKRIRHTLAGHPVEFSGETRPLSVEADLMRLDQALYTLLQRAIRVSVNGLPVDVRLRHEDGWVLISVRDHGTPLLPLVAATLQQPYHDDADDLLIVRTLGVGLYVARATVALHQGSIVVSSDSLQGTIITIRLPLPEQVEA